MAVTIKDDPDALAAIVRKGAPRIVGLDGCVFAGKTKLAERLRDDVGGAAIDLDPFYDDEVDSFVEGIRTDRLKASVEEALTADGPVFISGVCLRKVLLRIGIKPDLAVYVMRVSKAGVPGDLNYLDCEEQGDISQLENRLYTNFDREVGRYHSDFGPKSRADVIYERIEGPEG